MTEYYMVRADLDQSQPVMFDDAGTATKFVDYVNASDGVFDVPSVNLIADPDDDVGPVHEVLSLFDGLLLLADRVRNEWGPLFDNKSVEWISANYNGQLWWILRSKVSLDAVCEASSSLVRTSSGAVISIAKLTLDRKKCGDHQFFGLSNGFQSWPQVVTARVMYAWVAAGFRGLTFCPLLSQ